ncbi:conserved exported hypothetical protein [uncultured spirochete]|uniref:DUF5723 domain-containing protein n=1 Tax=uncultured spirochete TaxID=156406 RepID=A0A3P3XRM9_9SPIR|nr:conserved exported hypothetical protein [uncultured spirochete]
MKRKALIVILLITAVLAASAQIQFSEIVPKDARSMGMGGTFRVFSQGYSSFFGNPAGFAGATQSFTLADVSAWAYLAPTSENLGRVQGIINDTASDTDILGYAGDWLASNNGLGAGASVGGGWVGKKGLAIGVTLVTDELAYGDSLLGAKLVSATQANGIIGFAYPINLGPVWLKVGADGRVFYRLQSDPTTGWPFNTILTDVLNDSFSPSSLDLFGGYGFAADAGLVFGVGPVMLGFTARDLGLEFKVGSLTAQNLIDSNVSALPTSGTTAAALTPTYTAGLGLRLFEDSKFEPSVYAEIDDPISLFSSTDIVTDVFTSLHAGAQLRLFRFISVRGGLNKGWYSVGAGLDLSFVEIDAAIFTEEVGLYPGDRGRSGLSVQAAIRFGR